MDKSSLSIIIPCYNEELAVNSFMIESQEFIQQFKQTFPHTRLQLIIVNNNSTDNSAQLLIDFVNASEYKEHFRLMSCEQQGYGAALKAGFKNESSDWYGFVDLDNTYPLFSFIPMLKLIQHSNLDMVFANRMMPGSEMNWIRKFGNGFYLFCAKILFNVHLADACSGMRIFSIQRKMDILNLVRNDLSFSIELTALALKNNWKILDYPIYYRDRIGRSKLSVLKDGWIFLKVLIKSRYMRRLNQPHAVS